MTDFLTRLASRSILSGAQTSENAPGLEPLNPLSGPLQIESFGLLEEHVEVAATPPTEQPRQTSEAAPQSSVPVVQPDAASSPVKNRSPQPAPTLAAEPIQLVELVHGEAILPPATAFADSDSSTPRTSVQEPASIRSAINPRHASPRFGAEPMADVAEPITQVAPVAPEIESVIEVHRIEGPVVPVVHNVLTPRADPPKLSKPAPRSLGPVAAGEPERTVVFVPREPLGHLGLQPLRLEEVLSSRQVADVAGPDSVIHVHIGRLDVSRPAPTYVPPPTPKPSAGLSLDAYLAERTALAGGRTP